MSDPSVSMNLNSLSGSSTPTTPINDPSGPTSSSTSAPISTSVGPSVTNQKQSRDSMSGVLRPGEEFVVKKRKLTSKVWNHMVKVRKDGDDWAICNYCKIRLKANSSKGTKSLHNHLETCPKKNNESIEESFDHQKQISLKKTNEGKVQFGNFTFDQEASRRELANAIIMHEYPLSMVEHIGFRRFVSSLQPLFKMVSRNTIKSDILKVYDIEKEKLGNWLSRIPARMAVTTDMWTSNQKKGYMSITAHFVDDNWKLQSRLLRYAKLQTDQSFFILLFFCLFF